VVNGPPAIHCAKARTEVHNTAYCKKKLKDTGY
jgi:hypothetical protein